MYEFEQTLWDQGFKNVMGLDEVGRGCLAGPVVAAGVILNPYTSIEGLNDSKKMTEKDRVMVAQRIKSQALFWSVKEASVSEIDEINILHASILAMNRCVQSTNKNPDYLLIDGNKFYTDTLIPFTTIVKGDSRSASIAAASILAKVYRDDLMTRLAQDFPFYGWDKNVGYPTKAHRRGITNNGPCEWHRTTFKLL